MPLLIRIRIVYRLSSSSITNGETSRFTRSCLTSVRSYFCCLKKPSTTLTVRAGCSIGKNCPVPRRVRGLLPLIVLGGRDLPHRYSTRPPPFTEDWRHTSTRSSNLRAFVHALDYTEQSKLRNCLLPKPMEPLGHATDLK